jgi:hypothetical protein
MDVNEAPLIAAFFLRAVRVVFCFGQVRVASLHSWILVPKCIRVDTMNLCSPCLQVDVNSVFFANVGPHER